MLILAAFPETAEAVARAAMFYKARAVVLRWASHQAAAGAAADNSDNGPRRRFKKVPSLLSMAGGGGGAQHAAHATSIQARRHSGVVRPLSSSPMTGPASVNGRRTHTTGRGSRDPRLARSLDKTPICARRSFDRQRSPKEATHTPWSWLKVLREDSGVGAGGVAGSAAEFSTAAHQPSNGGGTDAFAASSNHPPPTSPTNDRQQLGALRDQMAALDATCAARFGSLEATCAARFGSIEAVLRRLDRRMGQATSYGDGERTTNDAPILKPDGKLHAQSNDAGE